MVFGMVHEVLAGQSDSTSRFDDVLCSLAAKHSGSSHDLSGHVPVPGDQIQVCGHHPETAAGE